MHKQEKVLEKAKEVSAIESEAQRIKKEEAEREEAARAEEAEEAEEASKARAATLKKISISRKSFRMAKKILTN